MATKAYTSPGVSVSEAASAPLAPLVAGPSVICIVGPARGKQFASERLILGDTSTPDTPAEIPLRYTGVTEASVTVKNSVTGEALNAGNWEITPGADPDTGVVGDEPYTIKRRISPTTGLVAAQGVVGGGGVLNGTYRWAYSFTNADGETGLSPYDNVGLAFDGTYSNAALSSIDVGPTGTTGRKVYRSKFDATTGWSPFHLVATIGDNVATVATDNITDAAANLAPVAVAGINATDTVLVSYEYVDQYYYEPTFVSDYNDIVDKYGDPFDADGNISSKLSLAARIAFQNGASEIVALSVVADNDAGYVSAFGKLEDDASIRLITVASGAASIHTSLAAHVTNMNTQGLYRQAVVGRDGSASSVSAETLRSAATAFNNEAVIMVSPANFKMQNPVTGREQNIGSQYVAAGIAGMLAARDVQVPLTRKTLAGFISTGDRRTSIEQALDSQSGLLVVVDRGGILQIRHGISTAAHNVNTAEVSVVRAKYEMAHRLRDALDGSIVGQVIPAADVPLIVGGVISGVLEGLLTEGSIHAYFNVKARVLQSDPTTVEGRFEYRPAYPINNVIVRFTINSQTGEFEIT